MGDSKYGVKVHCASTQLLHAYRLKFGEIEEEYTELTGLSGLKVTAEIPTDFQRVWEEL